VRSSFAQARYDLLLKGGHVIDAKNNINSVQDVAIKDGNIAAVARDLQADQATIVVDAKSLYVVPGIVDIHVHVFADSIQREYTGDQVFGPIALRFERALPLLWMRAIRAGEILNSSEAML
jgi:dihydroorotase